MMGKICEVYYKEIDPNICDPVETGEFYFFYNLLGVDDRFQEGYEQHEIKQLSIRNRVLRNTMDAHEIPRHPKVNTTIFGLSSLKDSAILVVEY